MGIIEDIESNERLIYKPYKENLLELANFAIDFDGKYNFEDYSLERILSRLNKTGNMTEIDDKIFSEILRIKSSLERISRIVREAEEKTINDQINECWEQYNNSITSSEILTYIPDDVETGYIPVGEFEAEEKYGITGFPITRSRNQ